MKGWAHSNDPRWTELLARRWSVASGDATAAMAVNILLLANAETWCAWQGESIPSGHEQSKTHVHVHLLGMTPANSSAVLLTLALKKHTVLSHSRA